MTEIIAGSLSNIDRISPTYVSGYNPKYLEIDGKYISTFLVVNYNNIFEDIIFKNIIQEDISLQMNVKYEKLNKYKTIKEITYYIGNSGATLRDIGENRQDVDLVAYSYNDAKYIRRKLQTTNEEIYYIYTYITIIEKNLEKLKNFIQKLKGICVSSGIEIREANFRQEEAYKAVMPIGSNEDIVSCVTKRNILSSSLVATYPFAFNTISDDFGILHGKTKTNNSLVIIDRFNRDKYKNGNMCIFGTSGSGKSYYTKLNILREFLNNTYQYIIDPEGEYKEICEILGGSIIKIGPNSKKYINILDINYIEEEETDEEEIGILRTKLNNIKSFFYLIFENITDTDYSKIEECIIKAYEKFGITFNDDETKNVLIENENKIEEKNEKEINKTKNNIPVLEDVYNEMLKYDILEKYCSRLKTFISGSLSYFNNHTNVNLDNKLLVADITDLGEENYKYGMSIFIDAFWNRISKNKESNKIIYIDEIWRIIGATSNKETASFVYKIFKTIRKRHGAAVAITQDIGDLFSLDEGALGRSILSNSSTKAIFSLEEENIGILSENIQIADNEKVYIKSLKKGECMLIVEDNHILMEIISNDLEKSIITGEYSWK